MAKKPKETNVPLIIAVIFLALTTITFGVMWYMSFSEIESHVDAKKNAEKDLAALRSTKDEAERLARVYRIYLGTSEGEDITTINTEAKPDDKIAIEVKKINEAVAKKLGFADASALPDEFKFWTTDGSNKANTAKAEGLADAFAKIKNKDVAYQAALASAKNYEAQITQMKKDSDDLKAVVMKFNAEIAKLPGEVKDKIDAVTKGFDKRTAQFVAQEATNKNKLDELIESRGQVENNNKKLTDKVTTLSDDLQRFMVEAQKAEQKTATFDAPQGKILRKLAEGVVEINIGSSANVRPGLTFTVLPVDFPQKGRQSRMRMLRQPDGKGAYKSVETFVPRGSIEVFEVVGPTLSLARIQAGSEADPITDGIAHGDLLYNSVWRKGVADHIALIGIFDVNGDGTDDIASVVRDFTRMGIPVDAYYDMKKRVWVGQVTERTRYIVEGFFPLNSATDPNQDEKTKLREAMDDSVKAGKQKGVNTINYREFFGRMGYKFRLDVTDDKVNQATLPYLSNVGVAAPPPEK